LKAIPKNTGFNHFSSPYPDYGAAKGVAFRVNRGQP